MSKKHSALPLPEALVGALIEDTHLLSHPDCPFSYHLQPQGGNVLVVAGDNATGKSLIASMSASRAYYDHGVEPMVVSMTERTRGGMLRAFTYGGEDYRATGEVSLSVSFKAINAITKRIEDADGGGRALVILDEPDVGLAEGFSHAFGCKLGQKINELPKGKRWGVIVISHSREMVRGLRDTLEKAPGFMHTDTPMTLDAWCAMRPCYSVDALDAMLERASGQVRKVRAILDEAKNEAKNNEGGAKSKTPRSRR